MRQPRRGRQLGVPVRAAAAVVFPSAKPPPVDLHAAPKGPQELHNQYYEEGGIDVKAFKDESGVQRRVCCLCVHAHSHIPLCLTRLVGAVVWVHVRRPYDN